MEQDNEHILVSSDGKAAVWVGIIDDLWQLGKSVGKGGLWKDTEAKVDEEWTYKFPKEFQA